MERMTEGRFDLLAQLVFDLGVARREMKGLEARDPGEAAQVTGLGGGQVITLSGAGAVLFREGRFDELPRLRELVAQLRAHREAQVTDHGHILAVAAATAGMGPCGVLGHRWDGLEGLRTLKTLDDALADDVELEALANRLLHIRDALESAPRQAIVVSESAYQDDIRRHRRLLTK